MKQLWISRLKNQGKCKNIPNELLLMIERFSKPVMCLSLSKLRKKSKNEYLKQGFKITVENGQTQVKGLYLKYPPLARFIKKMSKEII